MNELVFVGLGLNDERGISVKGLEEAKAQTPFSWRITPVSCPTLTCSGLKRYAAKNPGWRGVSLRKKTEKSSCKPRKMAKRFSCSGRPFIATTHVTLRIDAEKTRAKTRVVHGTSIMSAVVSLSGLHNYKFGKTVTVPFPENF